MKWLLADVEKHFEILYKSLYRRLYLFANHYLMDEQLAEDTVQEVFAQLWHKTSHWKKEDIRLEPYLFRMLKNSCIDYHRRVSIIDRYHKHLSEVQAWIDYPFESDESEQALRVKEIVSALSEMQQKIIRLSVVDGLKYKEIADRLGIAEGTVHTHIKRAYRTIKKRWSMLILFFRMYPKKAFDPLNEKACRR